jgi:aspartyl-tRNA(Asn)/glutamyl-tRNA(Gln) amidotransferase subunit B
VTAYETVIGLEVHVELSTRTKMFCGCANVFGAPPNTLVCEVCLGHPGTLPVANRLAVEHTMTIGLALGCDIAERSLFHRKNYFYPDMPKNYQISQYDLPLCVHGTLEIEVDGAKRGIGVHRVHLEEDTGKSTHASASGRIADAEYSMEDFNRAGVPLVEIVSEPDMRSPEEARAYLQELRQILETLGVSDVRMEEGSLRCDANVSLRPVGTEEFGKRVEVKNLNSVRSLERAIRFEVDRQAKQLDAGESVKQETRHWDENEGVTKPLRSKEEAFDYRYFPEPDLQPIEPGREWVERLRAALPESPAKRRERFAAYDIPKDLALQLAEGDLGDLFEEAVRRLDDVPARTVANWISQNVAMTRNEADLSLEDLRGQLDAITQVIALVDRDEISISAGKEVLDEALRTRRDPNDIVDEKGLRQISDTGALQAIVDQVIADNAGMVAQFREGKESVIGALIGQVMKASGGSANPKEAQRLLRETLAG